MSMSIKVILVGDSGVGKSSILKTFIEGVNINLGNTFTPTIGLDFASKTVEYNSKKLKMLIWDSAGQERFQSLIKSYYRNIDCVVFVYDVSNKESFENIEYWIKEFDSCNNNNDVIKVLVGNKIDLQPYSEDSVYAFCRKRIITKDMGIEYAASKNISFFETSSRFNLGIDDMFNTITQLAFPFIKQDQHIIERNLNINSLEQENTSSYCYC